MIVRWTIVIVLGIVHLVYGVDEINRSDESSSTWKPRQFQDMCPCLPMNFCPRLHVTTKEDAKYLGDVLKCDQEGYIRCCGVSLKMVIEIQKQMALLEDTISSRTTRRTSLSDNILAKSLKLDEEREFTTTQPALDTEIPTTISENFSSTEDTSIQQSTDSTEVPETTTAKRKLIKKKRRRRVKIRLHNNTMEVFPNEMSGIPHTTPINMDSDTEKIRLFDPEVGTDVDVIFAKNETESKDEKNEERIAELNEQLEPAESQRFNIRVLPEENSANKTKSIKKASTNLKNSTESQHPVESNKTTSAIETNVKQKLPLDLEKPTQTDNESKSEIFAAKKDNQTEQNIDNKSSKTGHLSQSKQEQTKPIRNSDPLDTLFKQVESERSKIRKTRQFVDSFQSEGIFPISSVTRNQQQPITSSGYPALGNYLPLYPIPDEPEETDDITPYERLQRSTDHGTANESQEEIVDIATDELPILVPEGDLPVDALPDVFPDENSSLWSIDANQTNAYQPIFGQYIEDSDNDQDDDDDEEDFEYKERSLPVFIPLEQFSIDDLPEEFPEFTETEPEHSETMDSIIDNQHNNLIENLQKMLKTSHSDHDQFGVPNSPPKQSIQSLIMDRSRYQIPSQNLHKYQNDEQSERSLGLDDNNDLVNKITVKRSENSKDISIKAFRGRVKFNSRWESTEDSSRSGKKLQMKPMMIKQNILNETEGETSADEVLSIPKLEKDPVLETTEIVQQLNEPKKKVSSDQQDLPETKILNESPIVQTTEKLPEIVSENSKNEKPEPPQNESETIDLKTEPKIEIQPTGQPIPKRQFGSRTNLPQEYKNAQTNTEEMRSKRRRKILKRIKVPSSTRRSNKQAIQINEATMQSQTLADPSPILYIRLNQENLQLPTTLPGIPFSETPSKPYTAVSSIRVPIIRRPLRPGNLHLNSIASYGIVSGKDISTILDTRYVPMFPNGQPLQIIGPIPEPIFSDLEDRTKESSNIVFQLPVNDSPTNLSNF